MNMNIEHATQPDKKEIGLLAYQLWEKAGQPSGKDLDFWLEAEKQLRNAVQPIPTIPVKLPPAATKQQRTPQPAVVHRSRLSRLTSSRRTA
ncbi:MAG: DUF2934 domain-containing protein [Limisphaerales bacterium]